MTLSRLARRAGAAMISAGVLSVFGSLPASAACQLNQLSVAWTPSPIVSSYDPFVAGDTVVVMTLTVTNNSNNQTCDAVEIAFTRSTTPASMTNASQALQYDVTRAGGSSILTDQAGAPTSSRLSFTSIPAGGAQSRDIELRILQGQIVPALTYNDNLTIFYFAAGGPQSRQGPTFSPQATVIAKCILPSPSLSSLDLSSAISNGRPNEGVKRSTTFSNVQCTAPTKLRLTGAALQPTVATGARPGFDNFINYRAVGTFGIANSTLTTTTTLQSADSMQKNIASGATANGQIDIDVNLINGHPIIAGTYSGVLTVSVDPTF